MEVVQQRTVNGVNGIGRSLIALVYSIRVDPIKLLETSVGEQESTRDKLVAAHESLVEEVEKICGLINRLPLRSHLWQLSLALCIQTSTIRYRGR